MPAYMVRNADTKTICALIVAQSIAELWDTVDEVADPADFEYRRVSRGGIICTGEQEFATSKTYPLDGEDEGAPHTVETGFFSPEGVALTEMADIEATKGRWTRFDFADEGDGMIARLSRDAA